MCPVFAIKIWWLLCIETVDHVGSGEMRYVVPATLDALFRLFNCLAHRMHILNE